jgi:hypothetical protein
LKFYLTLVRATTLTGSASYPRERA